MALLEEEPEPPIKRFHCSVQSFVSCEIDVLLFGGQEYDGVAES